MYLYSHDLPATVEGIVGITPIEGSEGHQQISGLSE